jgi:hypothetical protein
MPRFYLHIREQDDFIEDIEGQDFVDLESARTEAVAAARDLLAAKVQAGEMVDGQRFEICDESGRALTTVPFQEALVIDRTNKL